MQEPVGVNPNAIVVPRIVWIAILFSIGVLWFLSTQMKFPEEQAGGYETLLTLFSAVAVANAIASFVVPAFLLRGYIRQNAGSSKPMLAAQRGFFAPFLVQLALRESIAVLGFVLVASGAPQEIFLYFGSASAVLVMMAKPSLEQIKELEQRIRTANSTPS